MSRDDLPSYLQPQVDTRRPPRDERDPRGMFTCAHCGERFVRATYRDLHTGRAHEAAMMPDESADFAAAAVDETESLRRLRRHVISGFAAFPVILGYFANWILILAAGSSPAFIMMVTPGYVAFAAVIYGLVFSRLSLNAQREDARAVQEKE